MAVEVPRECGIGRSYPHPELIKGKAQHDPQSHNRDDCCSDE
jgi:hypothetical protein